MWNTIKNFEDYKINDIGLVMNKHGKILKPRISKNGYNRLRLYNEFGSKNILVHRLVLQSFVGENDLQVNHKNGNKLDNKLSNLEYVSRSENQIHRYYTLKKGIKAIKINDIDYVSFVEAAKALNITPSYVSALYRKVRTSNKYVINYD